ncbi:hypothetical protein NM688_g8993 [Phlebia brevispora]|uniref:Uncharacterized protein n=1 Tax=Phlebia brevispora TaxID=194682 RepID=A0ACC1RLW7_9APHY|nr:hypothetical protein NM688_g8993 [Phlebia brevispora]
MCYAARPCQRCIKRGMADNCTEGHRKKAKYLLDDEELEALKRTKLGIDAPSKSTEAPAQQPSSQTESGTFAQSEPMFTTYDPATTFPFPPSDAANLEAHITMLNAQARLRLSNHPRLSERRLARGNPSIEAPPPTSNGYGSNNPTTFAEQTLAIQPSETTLSSSTPAPSNGFVSTSSSSYQPPSQQFATPRSGPSPQVPEAQYTDYTAQSSQVPSTTSLPPYNAQSTQAPLDQLSPPPVSAAGQLVQRQPVVPPTRSSSANLLDRAHSSGTASWAGPSASELEGYEGPSVYKAVTKPYDYTEGYHFLMKHLPTRGFEKNDILRIVRALAIYRPSLIALQMPMSEEDEVFIEKCFQRSLVELDKLVSFSGTPTLAWRRTGEICLVGPEFCMLTGWEREELLGRKKYIYELFENQSVVEYWENFANHAFENTTQSVYSHCVLLKPSGAPVPCTFCFSIRRDIMDLPSLVIGQWLPLL